MGIDLLLVSLIAIFAEKIILKEKYIFVVSIFYFSNLNDIYISDASIVLW